jgi:hypothetical protein
MFARPACGAAPGRVASVFASRTASIFACSLCEAIVSWSSWSCSAA